jgi:hypothetical protein
VPKVRDIVNLYINPREHAVALCGDEESQIECGSHRAVALASRAAQTFSCTACMLGSITALAVDCGGVDN